MFSESQRKILIFSFVMNLFHFISGYLNAVSENMQLIPIILPHSTYKNRPTRQTVSTTKILIFFDISQWHFSFFLGEEVTYISIQLLFHTFKSQEE